MSFIWLIMAYLMNKKLNVVTKEINNLDSFIKKHNITKDDPLFQKLQILKMNRYRIIIQEKLE